MKHRAILDGSAPACNRGARKGRCELGDDRRVTAPTHRSLSFSLPFPLALTALALTLPAAPAGAADAPPPGWQACAREADPQARLACFDGWAGRAAPAASALQPAP